MHCVVAYVLAAVTQVIVTAVTLMAVGHGTDRHHLILWYVCAHRVPGTTGQKCS